MEYRRGVDEFVSQQSSRPLSRGTPAEVPALNQIDAIIGKLSPDELSTLRDEINARFEQALAWYSRLMLH